MTVVGLGSNLIVRDGGVPGVVIRLGRGFNEVKVEAGARIRAGAAVPDVKVSRTAQEAAIAGLAFFRGIPGGIGGALAHERRRLWPRDQGCADRGTRLRPARLFARFLQ